ncbi:MAG: histidine kinase dimerization/phospho-acceptor domain-containing protein [bacterium]
MAESYLDRPESEQAPRISGPIMVAEPSIALARELIAQLLPGYDADKVLRALIDERDAPPGTLTDMAQYNSDEQISARELDRVRAQLSLGEAARTLQHAFNNPLTALLAEAQLLEIEPLADEPRAAVARILEQARRLVALSRKLGVREVRNTVG